MDLVTLLLLIIAISEGFMNVLQLLQMIGTRVAIGRVYGFLGQFNDINNRVKLFSEISHGVMKAISERAGAVKGGQTRSAMAEANNDFLQNGDMQGMLMTALGGMKGNVKIGGFSIPKAEAAQFIFSMLQKGGLQGGQPMLPGGHQGRNGGIP